MQVLGLAVEIIKVPKLEHIVMRMAAGRPWELLCRSLRYQNWKAL